MTVETVPAPAAGPTHYALRLAKPHAVPGTGLILPAGDSVVSAAIVDTIPIEIVLLKTPAVA